MSSITKIGLLISACTLTLPVYATDQNTIIVTATRTTETVDESLASVTVITRDDIEKIQATDLTEILTTVPGIDISSNGGMGKTTNLYMRGTNTGHTLVLIDGVQIGSATLGQVNYQDIPVDLIERIEIVRGPRASLYGSEALGGVIQIFTRKATEGSHASMTAGAGTENTTQLNAGYASKQGNTAYSVFVSGLKSEGINVRKANDPDKDGYERQSVNASIKHNLNKTDYIEFTSLISDAVNEYDGFVTTTDYQSEIHQEALGLKGVFNAGKNWQVTLSASQNKDESDELENNVKIDSFNTQREALLWQNDITLNEANLFTVGLEKQDTSVSGTSGYTKNSRANNALFIQNNWTQENNDILVSLRSDDNEAFGNHSTGSIAWGYTFGYNTRLIASAGTAFKAPSFNDLYFPDVGYARGNPNVLPEESESYEVVLKQKNWQISVYKTRIENLIAWDNASGVWTPENVNNASIRGMEFQLAMILGDWNSQLQLSLADPRDTATGAILNNRSRASFAFDLDKDFGSYSIGSSLKAQSTRYAANELPGYATIDLRASYAVNKQLKLRAKLNNALDKNYTISDGYNTLGRNGMITVNYQF